MSENGNFRGETLPCHFLHLVKCTQTSQTRRKLTLHITKTESLIYLPPPFRRKFQGSFRMYLPSGTISRCVRNPHVLQNSRNRLGGQVKSWQGSWCSILVKISGKLLYDCLSHPGPSPGASGTSMSSKTPGRDLEDRWSLDRVPDVQL